jgi:tRNA(Phe) wybutosine-synthesizing methylase Tyw3
MKETLMVTGKSLDEVIRSTNSIIQRLANKIIVLENKLQNTKGNTSKVEKDVVRVVSDVNNTTLEVTTSDGKFKVALDRKE